MIDYDGLTGEQLEALVMPVEVGGAQPCDRVGCQIALSHQACNEQPIQARIGWSTVCQSGVQPYQRRLTLTAVPVPLDTNWVTEPGYVLIENRTGMQPATNMPPEEQARLKAHLILIIIGGTPVFSIPPGRAFLAHVEKAEHIALCSNLGEGTVTITVMPR